MLPLATMREKVLHRPQQIGSEPALHTISAADGIAFEDTPKELMSQIPRFIGIMALTAQIGDHRGVVGRTKITKGIPPLARSFLGLNDLRPPGGMKSACRNQGPDGKRSSSVGHTGRGYPMHDVPGNKSYTEGERA